MSGSSSTFTVLLFTFSDIFVGSPSSVFVNLSIVSSSLGFMSSQLFAHLISCWVLDLTRLSACDFSSIISTISTVYFLIAFSLAFACASFAISSCFALFFSCRHSVLVLMLPFSLALVWRTIDLCLKNASTLNPLSSSSLPHRAIYSVSSAGRLYFILIFTK